MLGGEGEKKSLNSISFEEEKCSGFEVFGMLYVMLC